MDASGGFKAQGSIGIPDTMKKQMEEVRLRKDAPPAPDIEPKPEPVAEEKDELLIADADELKNFKARKAFWEKRLEIKVEGKDLQDYLFKGRVTKQNVYITSYEEGKKDFRAVFQTLTPADTSEIDEKMATFRDKGKFTPAGLENEQALLTLSYSLLAADGRSLGENPETRYKNIRQMGGMLVDLFVKAYGGVSYLLDYALQEKKL